MRNQRSSSRLTSMCAAVAVGAGALALAVPAQAAPPALGAPEILGGSVSPTIGGGSLTGSNQFGNAAFAIVAGPRSIVEPTMTVRWNYTNSDPASERTRMNFYSAGIYTCPTATFDDNACTYRASELKTQNERYTTAESFLVRISNATPGAYIFPSMTLVMMSGTQIKSRATTGSLVIPSGTTVNPPALTGPAGALPGVDQAALTVTTAALTPAFGVEFNGWDGIGTRTPSRTVRVFDCPQAFTTAVPPAQPTGCTLVREAARGTNTGYRLEEFAPGAHVWAVGRYLVATDTLALASPGLLTAHERAASYRIVAPADAAPQVDPNVQADPNAGTGAGGNAAGNAGAGNVGAGAGGNAGESAGGTSVDPGGAALIGLNPQTAPLVSENGVGTRNAVTLTIQAPARTARGVAKVYRAVLSPTTQAGKVIFTIARATSGGTMRILKKATAKVTSGTAVKRIAIPRSAPKGKVRVYASYLPQPKTPTGMTVSRPMILK